MTTYFNTSWTPESFETFEKKERKKIKEDLETIQKMTWNDLWTEDLKRLKNAMGRDNKKSNKVWKKVLEGSGVKVFEVIFY